MEHVYLARQVILQDDGGLFAYEVLYRDSKVEAKVINDRYASSAVVSNILNRFGTKEVLKGRRAFIKIDEKFLKSDLIFTIPNEFFVFSLFHDIEIDEKIVERLEQLHHQGYILAISDINLKEHILEKYSVVKDFLSYIKIDFSDDIPLNASEIIGKLKGYGLKVVASKIDTHEKFENAKKLGCSYFQGYFFAKPKILENEKLAASRSNILHLYNLLIQETNIDELTNEFEKNPEISIQLLQFINSGAFFFMKRISSIHHVLTLLGRVKLAQWLMLMIYSKSVSNSQEHSPLMELIQRRALMMEHVMKLVRPESGSNMLGEAYFVGVLSLIDTVLGSTLGELLDNLHISNEVRSAILYKEGLLGDIFQLVLDVEEFKVEGIMQFEKKYDVGQTAIKEALANCIDVEKKLGK